MATLNIYGCNIEAFTTTVVMASVGHDVRWCVRTDELESLLEHYRAEYQLFALWEMYVNKGTIRTFADHSKMADSDCVWLFLGKKIHLVEQLAPVISDAKVLVMSGSVELASVEAISAHVNTAHVFYIPFVFLQDGALYGSMMSPHLLLIGEKTPNTYQTLAFITPLIKQAAKVAVSNIKNTEFARSSIMAMLAARLSYMNEMSRLADSEGVDMNVVKHMMGLDSRIGPTYLNPSWGFGGCTLPLELSLLQQNFDKKGISTDLIRAISAINEDQKELIFRKFWQYFDSYIQGKKVLIWGAGYKAGSGRTLNSAIHPLLSLLWSYQVDTSVYDQNAANELLEQYPTEIGQVCHLTDDAYAPLNDVDAVFILNWPDVASPDIDRLASANVPVFDAQNLLTDDDISKLAGRYRGIGR